MPPVCFPCGLRPLDQILRLPLRFHQHRPWTGRYSSFINRMPAMSWKHFQRDTYPENVGCIVDMPKMPSLCHGSQSQ